MSTGGSGAGRGLRLHRPLRAVVAAAELIVAVVLAALAVKCWHRGAVMVQYPVDGSPQWITLVDGRWLGTAVGAATLGALLLLDAGRQLALAVRTRRRSLPELMLRPCKQVSLLMLRPCKQVSELMLRPCKQVSLLMLRPCKQVSEPDGPAGAGTASLGDWEV